MTSARELRQRWTSDRAADAAEALDKWMRSKRLDRVAFGTHEGRLDLRGLAIRTNVAGMNTAHVDADGVGRDYAFVTLNKPPEYHRVRWQSIDFSHADIDHLRLFSSEVRDCRFIGATMRDWRNWGTHFSDCDFSEADLENSNTGGAPYKRRHVEYTKCLWRQGRLNRITLSGGLYRSCRFEDVMLTNEHVTAARFDGCSFSGRLVEMRFDGRDIDSRRPWDVRSDAMVDCDFSNCALTYVEFLGIDTRTVTLPPQGQRVAHISDVARGAYQWAETADLNPNEKRFLQTYWNGHVTKLPYDAEGWTNLDAFSPAARNLLVRSMTAAI